MAEIDLDGIATRPSRGLIGTPDDGFPPLIELTASERDELVRLARTGEYVDRHCKMGTTRFEYDGSLLTTDDSGSRQCRSIRPVDHRGVDAQCVFVAGHAGPHAASNFGSPIHWSDEQDHAVSATHKMDDPYAPSSWVFGKFH